MSEFSDVEFGAGSLFGLRAFAVDPAGRLFGPSSARIPFAPGENVAACYANRPLTVGDPAASNTFIGGTVHMSTRGIVWVPGPAESQFTARAHPAGVKDCVCGFYAYFDGSNAYHTGHTVAAIIEGYGRCTIGTRGFRAEKARLVALIVKPKRASEPDIARMLRAYQGVPVYASKKAALAEHPLSDEHVPTPDSDPTFWLRPVKGPMF